MCKAAAKLKLLECGLLNAANLLDRVNVEDHEQSGKKDTARETVEEFEERVEQYVHQYLRGSSSARRGDYKDGPVYQARKKVIEEFIKTAQSNYKRCSRSECRA